jgi:hypothetical protein
MKKSPMAIALIMLLFPLAGCAGSDGEVNVDLTTEEIQELIDDNIDDFLNNTTITVNQENNNNSTVNHYNTTTIQQPSTLKARSGTMAGIAEADNYPIGASLLVRGDRYAAATAGNAAGLDGANICVRIGEELEGELQEWFSSENIAFTSVPIADAAEGAAKFIDGSCDVLAFASTVGAEEKKWQLDNDGSMGGVSVWTTALVTGMTGDIAVVGNTLSVEISQSSDEMINYIIYIFVQAKLVGTCPVNSTNCSDFELIINPETLILSLNEASWTVFADIIVGREIVCSNGVTFSMTDDDWSAFIYPADALSMNQPFGTGFDCTHSLNFHVSLQTDQLEGSGSVGYLPSVHELSWDDWVYSVVWESSAIEQTA